MRSACCHHAHTHLMHAHESSSRRSTLRRVHAAGHRAGESNQTCVKPNIFLTLWRREVLESYSEQHMPEFWTDACLVARNRTLQTQIDTAHTSCGITVGKIRCCLVFLLHVSIAAAGFVVAAISIFCTAFFTRFRSDCRVLPERCLWRLHAFQVVAAGR